MAGERHAWWEERIQNINAFVTLIMCACVCMCKMCTSDGTETYWISNTLLPAIYHLLSPYLCILWMLSGVNSARISLQQIEPSHAICFNWALLHCRTHIESWIHLTIITDRTDPQLCNVWLQKKQSKASRLLLFTMYSSASFLSVLEIRRKIWLAWICFGRLAYTLYIYM